MYIRGRILKRISILEKFGLDFISELAIYFERATYVVDDFLFIENDKAEFFYQIIIYLAFVRQNFFKYRNALFIIFLYVL